MAVKKFVIISGQSNALEVADARGWEDLHPYVALRKSENTNAQTKQWTAGAYSDTLTLPFTFFGGPARDRLGTDTFGSWQTPNVMSRAVQAVRFLTHWDPAAYMTNLGISWATGYPGTCEVIGQTVPTGTTFSTNARWQKSPVNLTMTRRLNGVVHTITSTTAPSSTVTVTPPLIPPVEIGEQFTYEFALWQNSTADNLLSFKNLFGGLQDIGSIIDAPTISGAVESGKHGCTISRIYATGGASDESARVTLRSRPVSLGSGLSFNKSTVNSGYLSSGGGGASMTGANITGMTVLGDAPWAAGDAIVFTEGNGTLPANITEGTVYYVSSVSGRTITVSETNDGTDLDVGASFAAGTTGPTAAAAPSLPSAVADTTTHYVTRMATPGETLALITGSWGTTNITKSDHKLGEGEAVSFTGTLPAGLTAGTVYYTKIVSYTAFDVALTIGGTSITLGSGGGDATMLREDSYFAFYISLARGGVEIVAATDTGRGSIASDLRVTVQESFRGSLTGLQATCTSAATASAANIGKSRGLGNIYLDGTESVTECAADWPATPQAGDKFTIEVPNLGQESIPFHKYAMWLPWCPFEGQATFRGPALAVIGSASGAEVNVIIAGIYPAEVGSKVRLFTNGVLPSPLKGGRDYYVHTAAGINVFLKETYESTEAIMGDDVGGSTGVHVITVHDQDGKINPFPPGFNYPNHHGLPLHYQAFEGPSLISRNPLIGIAPGIGLKLHEYYGEQMGVIVSAVAGTSIGHKEVFPVATGTATYGWLDTKQLKSWSPGEDNNCFARFKDVLDAADLAFKAEGNTGECVGIVWIQGEEDGSHLELANNYYRSAGRLKTAMREVVKEKGFFPGPAETIPFVHPQIKTEAFPYAATINAAIQQLVDEDAYSRTYEVADFALKDDGVHYTGAAMSAAAELAYAALIDMDRPGYTKVQVCNMALANLSDTATLTTIDPPGDSLQAGLCAQFWDLALNKALESGNWDFSTRRVSPVAVATDRTEWLFSYNLPKDFAGVISLLPEGTTDDLLSGGTDIRLEYAIANDRNLVRRIYTNSENVVLRYNARVKDPTQWSDSFVVFLSWTLSSMIAAPLVKGTKGIEAARMSLQMLSLYGQQAQSFDARKTRKKDIQDTDAPWDRSSR